MAARDASLPLALALAVLLAACGSGSPASGDAGGGDVVPEASGDLPAGDPGPGDEGPRDVSGDAPPDSPGELPAADLPGDPAPDAPPPDVPPDRRDPIFVEGCPVPGRAFARRTEDPAFAVHGPDGIARPGDFLLANDRAAFVIEDAGRHNAYYLYGGILVDAVAVDGCRQAGPERFQELGIMMGHLDAGDFPQSVLRAFRADRVEVVSDGSDGGPAIVRATGTDDFFWLVEDVLIRAAYDGGGLRPRSGPLGLDIAVDYVLAPGSGVLDVRVAFRNRDPAPKDLLFGCQTLFGLSTRISYWTDSTFSVGGFRLDTGVPWVMASAGDGAWAFAMDSTSMATTNISGVTALLDFAQVVGGALPLAPAGEDGDEVSGRYFVAAGPTDPNSAVRQLQPVNPEPVPGMPSVLAPLSGTVAEASTGAPVAGALVDLEARSSDGRWRVLDGFVTGPDGAFGGQVPDFGAAVGGYRLQVRAAGRPVPPPVDVSLADAGPRSLVVDPHGRLCVAVTDGDGAPLPAHVVLDQPGYATVRLYPTGPRLCAALPAGTWKASVTRGFEYTAWSGTVEVGLDGEATLEASLSRVVDTAGWMSVDTHCHAAPSPDNVISIPERIRTVAAEGLEVVVATDHEAVSDWSFGVDETGLQDWVATVPGEEVTATMPEHCTMLGAEPRFDLDARGGPVAWYGLDLQQLFDAMRDRGGRVVGLNHPRGWISDIGYDRRTGVPALKDGSRLGFAPDAALWTFDFDMVELVNGTDGVFRGDMGGMWDYWTSFLNLGHRITAVGSSDAHDWDYPGIARTYFPSSTDAPGDFVLDELVAALKEGRAVVSLGAFARVLVDGTAGIGDTVTDVDGTVDLAFRVEGQPAIDVAVVKVYVNCDEVLEIPATAPREAVKVDTAASIPVTEDAHVVLMGFGHDAPPAGFPWFSAAAPRFVTNPVYVDVDGNGTWEAPGGRDCAYAPWVP